MQARCLAFKSGSYASGMTAKLASHGVRPARATARMHVRARAAEAAVGIFGTKAGMMSYFTPEGLCVPATVIVVEEGNYVTQVKTEDTDGYNAVQVGYKVVAERKVKKPELGHLKKSGCPPLRHLREFRLKDGEKVQGYTPGSAITVQDVLKEGDLIDIAGTSIGKGFQGTIKRWGHKRGNMTHGSKSHRQHGSLGPGTTPGRVFPGLKMAGHMGAVRVKSRKLQVLKVDTEKNAIVVKGCVPGKAGNILEIAPSKIVGVNC